MFLHVSHILWVYFWPVLLLNVILLACIVCVWTQFISVPLQYVLIFLDYYPDLCRMQQAVAPLIPPLYTYTQPPPPPKTPTYGPNKWITVPSSTDSPHSALTDSACRFHSTWRKTQGHPKEMLKITSLSCWLYFWSVLMWLYLSICIITVFMILFYYY